MTRVQLELLINTDMVIMVDKGIRGEICHSVLRYVRANNKCMKKCWENNDFSYLIYLDKKNYMDKIMSQKQLCLRNYV